VIYTNIDWNTIALVTRSLDNPPAAATLQWEVPEDSRIILHSCSFVLTTDANAANRYVTLHAQAGGLRFGVCPAPGPQTASEAITYNFAPCVLGIDESADQATMWAPMTEHLVLERQHTFHITFTNPQAAYQLSNAVIRYYQAKPR